MESFLLRYPEIVKDAIASANHEINKQTAIRDEAAKKVTQLRTIDNTSPYTCIGSDAGQSEIAYNIEEARLRYEIEQRQLIKEWANAYLEYIQTHTEIYNFNSFKTFREIYTTVNKNHIERLTRSHTFECKCHFFTQNTNNNLETHFYTNGDECCSLGVPVYIPNIQSAIKTIGIISEQNPNNFNIYPVPTNIVD